MIPASALGKIKTIVQSAAVLGNPVSATDLPLVLRGFACPLADAVRNPVLRDRLGLVRPANRFAPTH